MKTYVFDIDNTICTTYNSDYNNSTPIFYRIGIINSLKEDGHKIIFYTARGMGRYNNDAAKAHNAFYDLTVKQLNNWGVKYDHLFLGKPAGDLYIDDKGINDEDYFNSKN